MLTGPDVDELWSWDQVAVPFPAELATSIRLNDAPAKRYVIARNKNNNVVDKPMCTLTEYIHYNVNTSSHLP